MEAKPPWQGRMLNQMQGTSSLGMALSGGAVGFSASIINPNVYLGFWTSLAFQMHAGFQFLSVAFGVLFFFCRLRNNDATARVEKVRRENGPAQEIERLQQASQRLATLSRTMIYTQIVFLCAAGVTFFWLMLLHYQRALYP
jgi:hypothetical protein